MRVGFPAVLGAASLGFVLGCSSGGAGTDPDETRTAEPPATKTPPLATPATNDPAKTAPLPPTPVKAEPSKTATRADPAKAHAARIARRQFGEALDEGRTASRAGESARAALAFERALAMRPVDSQALCEAGWAHFQAGDLERASARLTRAVHGLDTATGAGEPRTLAACLYNLGRVAEERGRRDEALAHYRRSVTLRPNETVRARLSALEAAPPAPGSPPAPPPPASRTFPSLAAAVSAEAGEEAHETDAFPDGEGSFRIVASHGPVGRVERLVELVIFSGGTQSCSYSALYAKLAAGWIAIAPDLGNVCEVDHGSGSDGLEMGEVHLSGAADGAAVIEVTTLKYRTSAADLLARPDPGREYDTRVGRLLVWVVTERGIGDEIALVTSVRVSSMRPNRRCEDRLLAAGEDEGMPAYGVDLTECAQDRRTDVDWSTNVTWNGTGATIASERGAPPTWILGTHDLAALGRLAQRQLAPP